MTKKVLFIITKSVWGGAQKYVHDLAVNLPKENFQTMIAGGGKGPMAEKIISAGLPYFEIKNFQRNVSLLKDLFSFFEISYLLFKTKPNIVHVSSSKAGGAAGLACFMWRLWQGFALTLNVKAKPCHRQNCLTLFTVHGWAFLEDRPKWQIRLIKFFSKITCLFYDKIICVSQNDYNEALKNKIVPARKMIIIHNGVKPNDYFFLEKTDKTFSIGTIGESVKNKGHQYLIEAAKQFPEAKLNIISGIQDASRYLKTFDIFVLPSVKEGLPYVILEAGLAGLPVIATNVGGILEIIENNKEGILVPPKNPEALAEAVKKLIADKKMRETLAANLHQKILSEFSLQKMLSATMSAYEK